MIMHQGSLEESVLKVRDLVAEWVGIRTWARHRNTCGIRDSPVTVVSGAVEVSWLRWGELREESIVVGPEVFISGLFFCSGFLTEL